MFWSRRHRRSGKARPPPHPTCSFPILRIPAAGRPSSCSSAAPRARPRPDGFGSRGKTVSRWSYPWPTEVVLACNIPYGATNRPRLVERIAEAGSVAGRGCSTSPQDMPDALQVLVLTVAGRVNRPPEDSACVSRRCCTNRPWPARGQSTGSSPADAIRHWSAEGGHPIEDLTADDDLTPLPCWAPGAKAIADDGLVAEERVLHPALTMVP